jgi:hypothetical protein
MALPAEQITHGDGVADSLIELEGTGWNQDSNGFWTGSVKYFVSGVTDLREGPIERGDAHGTNSKMYATNIAWKNEGGGDYTANVNYRGFIGSTAPSYVRQSLSSGRYTTTGENITGIPGTSGAVKAEVADRNIGIQDAYISETAPDLTQIGTAQTPPDAPSTPTFLWSSLTDAIVIYPSGWVLEDRKAHPLTAEDGTIRLYFVTDTYAFHHDLKPGDI